MKQEICQQLQSKDPRTLGPLIERIVNLHQRNVSTELKSQSVNHEMVVDYSVRKNNYQAKMKEKQSQIIDRINNKKKIQVEGFKKQSDHLHKIIQKFKKEDKARQLRRLDRINKRNFSTHNKQQIKIRNSGSSTPFFSLTQQQADQSQFRNISNSLDLDDFYKKKYAKIVNFSAQVQKKWTQKQAKIQQNKKILQDQFIYLKQQNQNKILRKIKADQTFQQKQNYMIKKSIIKLELSEKRSQEMELSQRQKSIERMQKANKNMLQIRKKRMKLQTKLSEKFMSLQKLIVEKQHKICQNKQNLIQSLVQNKKSNRLKKNEITQVNFNKSHTQFMTKMSDMYKKDRQQWGYLTSVGQFKDVLIEKNVYQSNQISLLK